jgi:hypothetical protein
MKPLNVGENLLSDCGLSGQVQEAWLRQSHVSKLGAPFGTPDGRKSARLAAI